MAASNFSSANMYITPVLATNSTHPLVLDSETSDMVASYYNHLKANLVVISTEVSVMNRHFGVEVLGPYRKWARSFYLLSRRHLLVDFVPKGSEVAQQVFIKTVLKQKTGLHKHHGKDIEVTLSMGRNKLSMNEMLDYASLLVNGEPVHNMLNGNQMAPNQDWEAPHHLIPFFKVKGVLGLDLQSSETAIQETLLVKEHSQPATSSTPAQKVFQLVERTGT